MRRRQRVGAAVGALGVHVDEPHLDGSERSGQLPLAAVALVSEPGVLGPPEDLLRLPRVLTPEPEPERLEPHRLERDVPGEHQQVGPRDPLPVLLLDRPQQPARLVEAHVVGPAVERGEPLRAVAGAAPPVVDAVRSRRVPAHPDEQRPVVAVVGRPPVLRRRHHLEDVPLQRLDVEAGELRGVVERPAHRVGPRRVLAQDLEVQLVRPPVLVGMRSTRRGLRCGDDRVLALAAVLGHVRCLSSGRAPDDVLAGSDGRRDGRAVAAQAPVGDLGLVDDEATVLGRGRGREPRRPRSRRRRSSRTTGRRRGGGCPRPAPRSARPSPTAGSAGPGRPR